MVGNFGGVLSFVIFVVDLAITKISPTKINVSIAAVIYGWIPLSLRGVVKNIVEAWPTVLSVGWVIHVYVIYGIDKQ
jgi:hypothetical protein